MIADEALAGPALKRSSPRMNAGAPATQFGQVTQLWPLASESSRPPPEQPDPLPRENPAPTALYKNGVAAPVLP